MQIYKELTSPASKEFEQLLNSQLSKTKIEEGKIIEGKINKITDKFVFLFIEGLKSEPVLDINELKSMGLAEKIKVGEKIAVLLERIEDKNGDVLVSASKAQKIEGWTKLVDAYEKNEPIIGKITSRCKGGCIVEHIETGSLMFLPGSQISDKPLKDISHLMNEPQKFALIKLDKIRGNACVSRRQIISSYKKEDKAKIISSYKVGQKVTGTCKGFTSFGAFFSIGDGIIDTLVHLMEISYQRISHPEEALNVGDVKELIIIAIDNEKLQISTSIRQLSPDPFLEIDNYNIHDSYKVKIVKILDFGFFAELKKGLTILIHNSEISHVKKNIIPIKTFSVGEEVSVKLINIDKEKKQIAGSIKALQENPFVTFKKKFPVGTICEATVKASNEYALFVTVDNLDEIDCFLHQNDLSFKEKNDEEIKKYKKGQKIQVKVLEIQPDLNKVRVSHKATLKDPFDFFKNKKVNDTLTVKVISSDTKGLVVQPLECEMEFTIKKSQIAINNADARPTRWTGGEKVDCALLDLNFEKRKVSLSIKLLEEIMNNDAINKFSSPLSGKNLPFSSLSDELDKKDKKKEKEKKEN